MIHTRHGYRGCPRCYSGNTAPLHRAVI